MGTRDDAYRICMEQMGTYGGDPYWSWLFGYPWRSPGGTPHCATGVSWVLDQAGVRCPYYPSAQTFDMRDDLEGRMVDRWQLERMDPISFDFDGDHKGDHAAFFLRYLGDGLCETAEFNTSGGQNKVCVRYVSDIICGIRPYWDGAANNRDGGSLVVDGDGGWNTVIDLQHQLGTYEDGIVSGQLYDSDQWRPNLYAVDHTGDGSSVVVALQRKVGANADSYWGYETSGKLQEWLAARGYYDGPIDHIAGPGTFSALQRSLNDKAWA